MKCVGADCFELLICVAVSYEVQRIRELSRFALLLALPVILIAYIHLHSICCHRSILVHTAYPITPPTYTFTQEARGLSAPMH